MTPPKNLYVYECSICKQKYKDTRGLAEAPWCNGNAGSHFEEMKFVEALSTGKPPTKKERKKK